MEYRLSHSALGTQLDVTVEPFVKATVLSVMWSEFSRDKVMLYEFVKEIKDAEGELEVGYLKGRYIVERVGLSLEEALSILKEELRAHLLSELKNRKACALELLQEIEIDEGILNERAAK
jgi:hypothetical protein